MIGYDNVKVLLVVTNISEENTATIITVVVSWKQWNQPTKPQIIVPKRPQYTAHKHGCYEGVLIRP